MITKEDLKQIESIRKEITYFQKKIKSIEKKPMSIVKDSVQASSKGFPYTKHTAIIEGFETPRNKKKYMKLLKNSQYKLEKKINNLEYELEKIEDSELRLILRYRYEDGLNYIQISHKLNTNNKKIYTEDSIRMRLNRFFEKIK